MSLGGRVVAVGGKRSKVSLATDESGVIKVKSQHILPSQSIGRTGLHYRVNCRKKITSSREVALKVESRE